MKRMLFVLAAPLVLALAGCPVDQLYPPGNPGTEAINKQLIGTWEQTDSKKEMTKVRITAKDKFSMHIEVLEVTENYLPEERSFTAWNTTINGMQFLYAAPDNVDTLTYYTYAFSLQNGALHTFDPSFLVGGSDAITSTDAFRKEIEASMKMDGFLSDETVWTRTDR